ncbi:MAG: ribosome maturation factor RimM [Piscirickettsiaceae bacterium]|nr:MAG: ribosome maturation factor RimM [Piscirickettsiaceae bacterium]
MSAVSSSNKLKRDSSWLKLGKISGVFGIKGWLKIFANTEDKENILSYQPWYIERNNSLQAVELVAGKPHGKTIIALLEGVEDRNDAETWVGCDIYMQPNQLPVLKGNQYYWSDLIGLNVINLDGEKYGVIDHMLETGANDVIVVKGDVQRLIPFVMHDVIKTVDLDARRMIVDWDSDY